MSARVARLGASAPCCWARARLGALTRWLNPPRSEAEAFWDDFRQYDGLTWLLAWAVLVLALAGLVCLAEWSVP